MGLFVRGSGLIGSTRDMSEESLEPLITQCPNCDTRFRVTESQLQVAAGRVRCGACLVVFDGTSYLSVDGEDFLGVEESADVDALLDELDEIGAREPAQAPPMPNLSDTDFIAVSAQDLADAQNQNVSDDEGLPAELLALEAQFLQDMRNDGAQVEDVHRNVEDALSEEQPVTEQEAKPAVPEMIERVEEVPEDQAEEPVDFEAAWDETVAQEIWDTDAAEQDVSAAEEKYPQDIELLALAESPPLESPLDALAADLSEEPKSVQGIAQRLPSFTDLDEDIELEVPAKRSWLTMVLILLGLVALPAQVLWFQYDAWTMNPSYRPVYEVVCQVTGCTLPPMTDVALIDAQRSIIRNHPDQPDARIVDVLMVNNAEFAQPYPLIELLATNMRGELIAGRRFTPEEYLRGETRAGALMPPSTPIHVSLEIQDPGENALNFEVKFR